MCTLQPPAREEPFAVAKLIGLVIEGKAVQPMLIAALLPSIPDLRKDPDSFGWNSH
jgi:hypothetical protein